MPAIDLGGLGATIDWYAGHRHWWEPLRERATIAEDAWPLDQGRAR